MSGQL